MRYLYLSASMMFALSFPLSSHAQPEPGDIIDARDQAEEERRQREEERRQREAQKPKEANAGKIFKGIWTAVKGGDGLSDSSMQSDNQKIWEAERAREWREAHRERSAEEAIRDNEAAERMPDIERTAIIASGIETGSDVDRPYHSENMLHDKKTAQKYTERRIEALGDFTGEWSYSWNGKQIGASRLVQQSGRVTGHGVFRHKKKNQYFSGRGEWKGTSIMFAYRISSSGDKNNLASFDKSFSEHGWMPADMWYRTGEVRSVGEEEILGFVFKFSDKNGADLDLEKCDGCYSSWN